MVRALCPPGSHFAGSRLTPCLVAVCAWLTWTPVAQAQSGGSSSSEGDSPLATQETHFGAAVAPAVLPAGASSAYGFAGAPEVGGGYRQGLGLAELEFRGAFDYFLVALSAEARVRIALPSVGPVDLAPILGAGAVYDTGTRYIDGDNFNHLGVRAIGGFLASYHVLETVRLLGEVEVPVDFSVSPGGGRRVKPLVGFGGEIFLGENLTAFAMGKIGLDFLKEPLGVTQLRPGFALRIGLGWRLF